jgi:hypothetical protein
MSRFSLSAKIYAAAGLVVFVTLTARVVDTSQMSHVAAKVERGVEVEAATTIAAREIQYRTLGLRRFEKDYFINISSKERRDEYFARWEGVRQ